jgi:phosphomannomutase
MPTLMVTGSHIPDDRNGIKFHTPTGEILKQDETAIRAQWVSLPSRLFDPSGSLRERLDLPPADPAAFDAYVQRYLDFLPADSLAGCRLGLYQHSSVAREVFAVILTGLGAEVVRLGFSSTFIPVDTEAIRPEDQALAAGWAAQGHYTALVSADGDGDRPLVADERGRWLRGDITGILTAHFLAAATVVTPVSSNTALERSGWFPRVVRTRIGSPYVIAAMQEALAAGATPVVGYEANGGFLTGSDLLHAGRRLPALPTRDAMLVALSLLVLAREQGCPISELSAELPQRFTCSDRLKAFPPELARARIAALTNDPAAIAATFGSWLGPLADRDSTDGLRMHFANGEIVHLRPSGNAPELRVYTEAAEPERATQLNQRCLRLLEGWRGA